MEGGMKRGRIPAFGSWNHCDMLPATAQYATAAPLAGMLHGGAGLHGCYAAGGGHLYPPHLACSYYWQDRGEDLFHAPPAHPVIVATYPPKVKTELLPSEKQLKRQKQLQRHLHKKGREEVSPQQIKHGKVRDCSPTISQQPPQRTRVAMAVDEDLYKIPSKLLHERPKRKKMVTSDFWSRCLGLSCIP